MKTNITAHMAGDLKLAPAWRKRRWVLGNDFSIRVVKKTKRNANQEEREVLGTGDPSGGAQLGCPHPCGTPEKSLPWSLMQMSEVRLKIRSDKGAAC